MLRDAIAKLEAALEIIDLHDIPLAGIHVANAINVLSERVEQADDGQRSVGTGRTGGSIN